MSEDRVREPGTEGDSRYLDRFGLLLSVTVASVVMLSLVDVDRPLGEVAAQVGPVVTTILVGATLLLALRASGVSRRWWLAGVVVVALILASNLMLSLVQALSDVPTNRYSATAPPAALVVLAALAPAIVVRRLLQHRSVTTGTLQGAIAAYLLIPVAYFYLFQAVDTYQLTPFFGQPESSPAFMYFSLSTLTTLGYGDIGAVTDLGRLLATSEAIVGQIYLVTFVAMIVGLLAGRRAPSPPA